MWAIVKYCFGSDHNVKTRLFCGYPVLGRFFSLHPVGLGLTLSLAAVVGMMMPAWLIGIHSFPSTPNRLFGNGGFLWSGWTLNFGLGLPLIFAVLAGVSRALVKSIDSLTTGPRKVIETKPGADPFWHTLSARLSGSRRPLLWTVALLTVGCTLIDNGDLWLAYMTGSFNRLDRLDAWDAAAYNPDLQFEQPISKFWTAIFNVVSLLGFQGGAIFLGFFFAFYFFLFVFHLSRLMFHDPAYDFRPMWYDLDRRLGLRPLGIVFNLFIVAALLYEIGVFLKRIELSINNGKTEPFVIWLTHVLKSANSADAFAALFTLEHYQFDTLDRGAYIALSVMVIPIGIVCYFPLLLYWECIEPRRSSATDGMRQYDDLMSAGDSKTAKRLKREIRTARAAELWPNGAATAKVLFAVMALIMLATWFPPVLAYGVVTGVVFFVAKTLWAKEPA